MFTDAAVRLDVPSATLLTQIAAAPLPLGLRGSRPRVTFHRDVYLDTPDAILQQRGVTCRFRTSMDDRRLLTITMRVSVGDGSLVEWRRYEAEVPELDAADALVGGSKPARRLRALIDPRQLGVRVELQTQRRTMTVRAGVLPLDRFVIHLDAVSVRGGSLVRTFHELVIRKLVTGGRELEALRDAFRATYGLDPVEAPRFQRAEELLDAMERAPAASPGPRPAEAVLLAVADGRVVMRQTDGTLRLPAVTGGGEAPCRRLATELGLPAATLRRIGAVPAPPGEPPLEVWLAAAAPSEAPAGFVWVPVATVIGLAGHPALRDAQSLAALAVFASSGEFDAIAPDGAASAAADTAQWAPPSPAGTADRYLNPEISWLEFNRRLVELADDPATPLLARLRYLAILSGNLDEFFMVRVGSLRRALADGEDERGDDGLNVREQLDAIAIQVRGLVRAQRRSLERLREALVEHDVRIRRWHELDADEQAELTTFFHDQVLPLLTPHAITRAPGHPFPHIPNLELALGLMVRDPQSGRLRFGSIALPTALPRLAQLRARPHFVPLEDVVGAHLQELYPSRTVEAAHCFRVTRAGDLALDERATDDLLDAVEQEVRRRPFAGVVRLELEREMPEALRDLLLRELRMVGGGRSGAPGRSGLYEVEGLFDLGALREVAALNRPELDYPPFDGALPLARNESVFSVLQGRELLVHHPYDAFDGSVLRLLTDAAEDPDVLAIKMTLYRAGARSPVVDALLRAAGAGKEVDVFVELKARFDEERNIDWVRKLERAGVHVVYGLVDLKIHAKVALVVRREGATIRRYAHVGTGNYHAATARLYTDVGLMTADGVLGGDLAALFNGLTGSSEPPDGPFRRLLVAPRFMLERFLALIERETEHARAGRGGRIRVKINGLADRDLVEALYRAAQAGVEVELLVRSICTLRAGVPGLSERIRVISVMGRFLEHARIFYFANGGEDEYYIGSADWRPRNLRRRVEVVTPVVDPAACARLEAILEREVADGSAWELRPDGSYRRRGSGGGSVAQDAFMHETRRARERVLSG